MWVRGIEEQACRPTLMYVLPGEETVIRVHFKDLSRGGRSIKADSALSASTQRPRRPSQPSSRRIGPFFLGLVVLDRPTHKVSQAAIINASANKSMSLV